MKITVLFHRFGPYHFARLCALAQYCELHAIEYSDVDKTYAWENIGDRAGFKRTILFSNEDVYTQSGDAIEKALVAAFSYHPPDVVAIPGWYGRHVYATLAVCQRLRLPAIVMSDSTEYDQPRVWWREWVKKQVTGCFSAALVGGKPHRDYLQRLGIEEEKIYTGYDVVDNAYFAEGSKHARDNDRFLRKKFSLPDRYFLSSNRFIAKKNLFRLIEAYSEFRKRVGPGAWKMVLLGDGELRLQIEQRIAELDLAKSVFLPGFKQYNELPVYYGLAEAYIHASTIEQWGLVVNEAMASGLPVLVSNRCGCAADLVREGFNGYQFDPYDRDSLIDCMVGLYSDEYKVEQMGQASREIIRSWTTDLFATHLMRAATTALESPLRNSIFAAVLVKALTYL